MEPMEVEPRRVPQRRVAPRPRSVAPRPWRVPQRPRSVAPRPWGMPQRRRRVPPRPSRVPSRRKPPSYFKKKMDQQCEVFFQNDFMQDHPWGATPEQWQDQCKCPRRDAEKLKNVKVPIHRLVHITHNAEARGIKKHRKFQFQAKKKFGKIQLQEKQRFVRDLHGRSLGETFRFDGQGKKLNDIQPGERVYVHIPDRDPVFPGFYSWWGIDCSVIPDGENLTSPHAIATMLTTLKSRQHITAYTCGYLKEVPESHYGNCAFSCNFRDLLRSYAESRRSAVVNIRIRKGGTLRYKKEICYVLIICIEEDEEKLSEYDVLQQFRQQQFQGLTNENGTFLDDTTIPTFNPEYIITWANGFKDYSYETAAFAFYFPDKNGILAIDPMFCSEKEIEHDEEKGCTKKKCPPGGGKWKCPNDC